MIEFEKLRDDVLSWLDSLRVPESCCRYKFHAYADDTIFCTCFALYILDLFKEAAKFPDDQRKSWISFIQGFQNEQYGWFEPEQYHHEDKERNRYQLTCFCLSALRILGAEPRFPLTFIEQWRTPDDVKKYLYDRGCHQGKPGSGNKAMFLAIFLTWEYERTKDNRLLDKVDAWFEFHNQKQNRSGFWGPDLRSHYLHGLQNGLHQLAMYFYWGREIPRFHRIIDVALMSQGRDGFFAPTPGGEACHDYDAVHILAMAHRATDYRKDQITACLSRAFDAILSVRNSDGGFCQSKAKLAVLTDFFRHIPSYFSGGSPYLWYYRSRASLAAVLRAAKATPTGWTREPRLPGNSNLWDTWFRCLALAEIAQTIDDRMQTFRDVNFQEAPGLGWFRQ
jgi:prenyltransferase beta subunit